VTAAHEKASEQPPVPSVSPQDRAAINPFAPLRGLLDRPMASYYLIVATTGLLLAIGLMMVLSASNITSYLTSKDHNAYSIFASQAMYAALGIAVFVFVMRLPVRFFRVIGYPVLIVSALGLFALLVAPHAVHGVARNGSYRWIDIGPVLWQPSESAKLGLALWGAEVMVRKRKLMTSFKHLAVPLFPVAAVLLGLVGTHDLGTGLCLLLILMALLWVSGVRLRVFGLMLAAAMAGVLGLIAVEPYRIARLSSFINPFADEVGGFQAVQGLRALATGGLFGVGLGASRQAWGYLPEAYNDFIFAIIGEELGLIGCIVVIGLFCVLAYTGFRIARRTADPYTRLGAATCTVWLVGQAFINMGAVVGLLPITGIPLPLISYGGSSLVLTLFALGMLAGFARAEPEAAAMLNERGQTLGTRLFGMPPVPVLPPSSKRT
jgi:cell division protein FtsW